MLHTNFQIAQKLQFEQPNFKPVACIHAPKLGYTFLATQIIPGRFDAIAGLYCCEEYGVEVLFVDLERIQKEVEAKGDHLEQDNSFTGKYNLAIYAKVADNLNMIVTDDLNEKAKVLFEKYEKIKRYHDPEKNMNRFKFESVRVL